MLALIPSGSCLVGLSRSGVDFLRLLVVLDFESGLVRYLTYEI